MSEKSLVSLLIVDGQSGFEAEFFYVFENCIRLLWNEPAILYIYDFAEFTLFVKTERPVAQSRRSKVESRMSLYLILCTFYFISDVFPEAEFYLIPVSFFLRWSQDGKKLKSVFSL